MTSSVTSAAEIALARHSPASLRDLAATLGSYVPAGGNSHDDWVRRLASVWNEPASAMRLACGLPEPTRNLLSVLAWGPADRPIDIAHLARIAKSLGCEPSETISGAVAFGAIVPVSPTESFPLASRKKLVEGGMCENVGVVVWPALAERLPAPEARLTADQFTASGMIRPQPSFDMAEWAVRLGALWQSATISPLRRTQAGGLHKKDRDLLLREPVLAEPPPDWPGGSPGWIHWLVDSLVPIAVRLGILKEEPDAHRSSPIDHWAEEAIHLQERFARVVAASLPPHTGTSDNTDEIDTCTGHLPWLPSILLADLSARPEGDWALLDPLLESFADRFAQCEVRVEQPRVDDESLASSETVIVRTRSRKKPETVEPARKSTVIPAALKKWVLGPARLAGLVDLGTDSEGAVVAQATALARFLTGHGTPPPPSPIIDKALFLQPNLEGILYRQSVTGQSLPKLATLLRFAGIGPVLQIRLDETWSRLMFGSGLTSEAAQARLTEMSAVEISRSVLETYRTWAGKSDRVRIHGALTLLETLTPEDRTALQNLADSRGFRAFPIGDRLLAIENSDAIPFDSLRLLAQQDQTQKPQVCIRPIEDGTMLEVDTARSDLALEPELARFTRPVSDSHSASPWSSATRLYRIDRESLAAARAAGVTESWLTRFFERRAGEALPSALRLLWSCGTSGFDQAPSPSIRIRQTCVLRTDQESTMDGLMCLNATCHLIAARLGPNAAEVNTENVEALTAIARELGIQLKA